MVTEAWPHFFRLQEIPGCLLDAALGDRIFMIFFGFTCNQTGVRA